MATDAFEINAELKQGEQALWTGHPVRGVRLHISDAFLIPFSVVWCGFAIMWEVITIRNGAPLIFRLWGIPFVVVGLFFVFGRFFMDAYLRSRTTYALTTERILVLQGKGSRSRSRSLPLRALGEVSLDERNDRTGTITFGAQFPFGQFFPPGWPGTRHFFPPTFDRIENARHVYELILDAQRKAG